MVLKKARWKQEILEILENPTFGPLVLIAQEDESAANPLFVQEALRTALQAYVASMESDPVGMMEKAKQTMTRLREAVGTDVVGKKRMLAIYVSLRTTMEAKSASGIARIQEANDGCL